MLFTKLILNFLLCFSSKLGKECCLGKECALSARNTWMSSFMMIMTSQPRMISNMNIQSLIQMTTLLTTTTPKKNQLSSLPAGTLSTSDAWTSTTKWRKVTFKLSYRRKMINWDALSVTLRTKISKLKKDLEVEMLEVNNKYKYNKIWNSQANKKMKTHLRGNKTKDRWEWLWRARV